MSDIKLRGRPFFTGLMAVLVSPTPIRVLCVYGQHKRMRDQFFECADQVLRLGQGFHVRIADSTIRTPNGSELIFSAIETRTGVEKFMGIELHDLWVEDGHEFSDVIWNTLRSRVRL